ncbi:protein PSK SIMULATOR 1-like [Salvia hispanica]|uniref:protein PSK SIMULATOR 1-like n=1 Tax=Salvia hispanica TaxID=49212 RepID=UPI002008F38B|nr:protein PSK SIMULATOR 1-like [Salvia hispanica]
MGGLCSRRATDETTLGGALPHVNGRFGYGHGLVYQSRGLDIREENIPRDVEVMDKQPREPFSFPELSSTPHGTSMDDINDGIPRLSRALSDKSRSTRTKQVALTKVSEMSTLLGRAGHAGLGKAVDVLDTLGSSMTNLNLSSGFASGIATKGIKISILAFEVANTIVKGANLMNSLAEENIRHLKEVVLPSEGIQRLTSRDMDELLRIAAADKRDELKVFSGEVIRFGNRCKDPQWHNLDRYFEKLESELTPHKQLKEEAESVIQYLMVLVQNTAELYHEMHALDRFEQDCRRKAQEEDNSNAAHRGDSLAILRAELKSQKKHVKNLKKKSLWSKILEEVMEKLVDIVHYLHLEIHSAFGSSDGYKPTKDRHQKLGSAGLALHYANIITQIDTLVTRSGSVPPSTRDALYQGLPPTIKCALRSRLQSFQLKEEFSVPQIKEEMEKTLQWLVPMATNTTKAHHGFGWVGEWANTGSEMNNKLAGQTDLLRIETLYHADKEKTEAYILDLVLWLHHLISRSRAANGGLKSPVKSPIRSPNQKTLHLSSPIPSSPSSTLSIEDQEMLRDVSKRKLTPGISKSQEFSKSRTSLSKHHRLTKSNSHSPTHETTRERDPFPIRRPSSVPIINFDIDRIKALDMIDRVDTI